MLRLKEKISEIVRREVEYAKKSHKINGSYSFSQHETLKRIDLYINDLFLQVNDPNAIFWNISNSRLVHFAKNIDFDTKDLVPIGRGDANFLQAWIVKMRFQKWMRDNKLSLTLNDLSEGLATYGSTVWKLKDDLDTNEKSLKEVDLRRLYFNPTAKTIRETPVVELHYLSELQIRDKAGFWNNIEDILKKAKKANGDETESTENQYMLREVWERWGEVMGEDNKVHYTHYIGAGYGENEVIAFDEECEREDSPYYDFHIGKYRGRWLRVGVVERLFKLQERANAVVNQNAEATQIASLLLMRTNDANTTGNVLEGAVSGQIINSGDLQQIGISNTAFNVLLGELDRIEKHADKLCFTPDLVTGDKMPTNIPFRSLAGLMNSNKSAFAYIKQSIGESVGFLIEEKILPSVVKKWNRGGLIDIAENLKDINLYDDQLILDKKIEYIAKANMAGRYVTDQELRQMEQDYRSNIEKSGRTIEIPKGFFNFDFGIGMNVTGENVDKSQQNDAYSNIMQWKQANPAVVKDPYFRQFCEDNQITPIRMSDEEINGQAEGLAMGKPAVKSPEASLAGALNTNQ